MLSKNNKLTNFSKASITRSACFRPENEVELEALMANPDIEKILARGQGLSYSDCCLHDQAFIIDMSRFNHLISFDEKTGIVVCQGSVTFDDLLKISPHYIPPVIPGTLKATIAGGIANDVHGKNNPKEGNFGHHIVWLELQMGKESYYCDNQTNKELFYATIAGLGLTGVIKRVALKMRKSSHFVEAQYEKYRSLAPLIARMQTTGSDNDYQVAWLDLLNKPLAILSLANHCEATSQRTEAVYSVPKLPLRLIYPWFIKQFNRCYGSWQTLTKKQLPLKQFNNPLDTLLDWNHLYGKKGLLQFQAVMDKENAVEALEALFAIIHTNNATPTLAVLKYFNQNGLGLLSFTKPGFTLAIDFINNSMAQKTIAAMNEWISKAGGKIYLAKDLFLTKNQFVEQYPNHQQFLQLLTQHHSKMSSDLGKRLGLSA